MDRLDAMRTFVRVAELGSFSAVAQQLGVARSVVTRQVAALEAHLGTKLMARSTRRLSLTSAGTAYLEKCRVILNLVDSAETDVAEDATARICRRESRYAGVPLSQTAPEWRMNHAGRYRNSLHIPPADSPLSFNLLTVKDRAALA